MLVVLLAVVVGTPCLGARTADRTRRARRRRRRSPRAGRCATSCGPASSLTCDGERGTIVVLHPSTVELERCRRHPRAGPQPATAGRTVQPRRLTQRCRRGPESDSSRTALATSGPPRPSVLPYSADRSPPGRTAVIIAQSDPRWCFGYGSTEGAESFGGPRSGGALAVSAVTHPRWTDPSGPPVRSATCSATSSCWSSTPPTADDHIDAGRRTAAGAPAEIPLLRSLHRRTGPRPGAGQRTSGRRRRVRRHRRATSPTAITRRTDGSSTR